MRITSKLHELNHHLLHAKLKTASHRFALMVDNYSPDDTEAEKGLLMVTGKVFVPGYTDATVTIVYPKRKRSTDQSFYYITPTESTEDMSLAYSDDTFYPRFSECEQAIKDLPEVTVSQYFYDKGIVPDDPSTFTALTGIPLESSLVEDINEITREDANYYTIGANEEHYGIDEILRQCAGYKNGDQIAPYIDITSYFINNGAPTYNLSLGGENAGALFVSPDDFYNSLTIILRQPSEHPELNTDTIYDDTDWCITITSTFMPKIENMGLSYKEDSYGMVMNFDNYVAYMVNNLSTSYMYSLYSSLDEWSNLIINGVLQIESQKSLPRDLREEYVNVCANGNPWTHKDISEFTIKTRDLDGFTPVEGLGNGVFHFVYDSRGLSDSLSHFTNPTFLNVNLNDNQLYLTDIPNPNGPNVYESARRRQYSTVYFASNKRGREIVFLHLPDTLLSGCLDTAPSWTTLNYLRTQGQQLMNCLQETILSLSNNDNDEPTVVDENDGNPNDAASNNLMNRLIDKGWEQQTPTTILSPTLGSNRNSEFKLQFTCINNTWSLSSIIVPCEATGGEVPLPLSDTQLNEGITSEDIQYSLEKIAESFARVRTYDFVKANSTEEWLYPGDYDSNEYAREVAIGAATFVNSDLQDLSNVTPDLTKSLISNSTIVTLSHIIMYSNAIEWITRVLQAFNLPHSLDIPSDYQLNLGWISIENNEYEILFVAGAEAPLQLTLVENPKVNYFPLWTDLFNGTPYADFSTIMPGVGPYLTVLHLFNQPLLDDPQILNNIQRIMNNNGLTLETGAQEDNSSQEYKSWLSQVTECMSQSNVFKQIDENTWTRSTDPIIINGTDYSQQLIGEITVEAEPIREEMRVQPSIKATAEAEDLTKYKRSLVPENLSNSLTQYSMWVSAEKINTLIGHDVLSGVISEEQLSALEENTNDVLPWLSNSSAKQVKAIQNAAGWVQYCDKILTNEEIPSLDFIKQGLHGNILNLLKKNDITGTTGVNYFLMVIGAVPIKEINGSFNMFSEGTVSHAANDICKYYAIPVTADGWNDIYCVLTFTKQNGKPVCQIQDDCLYLRRNEKDYRGVAHAAGTHLTTFGGTFNSLVTGDGLPDYNLLHFLQTQLNNPLQATDTAVEMLEANKEHIQSLL